MPLEADSMFQRIGGLVLPVRTADIGASGLASLDPGRDRLLEFFAAVINSELSEAWAAIVASSARVTMAATPVADTLPDEPTEQLLTQRKAAFPLLALHRTGTAAYEEVTLEITRLKQQWGLHYILGPLDAIDARQLKDVCIAVAKIVALAIRRRSHQSFEDGALQLFSDALGGPSLFSSLRILSHEGPGQAQFAGQSSTVTYWAIEMKLETTEISGYEVDADADLEALDIVAGLGGGEGLLPAVVLAQSDADPSL